ncbi:MAG: hypothetical protein ABEI52_06425, partial [Halobacteriaceae archaeon]
MLAIGAVATILGMFFVVAPGLSDIIAVGSLTIYAIGAFALLLSFLSYMSRRRVEFTEANTPSPESPSPLPAPGEEVNRLIREVESSALDRYESERRPLDQRLEEVAIRIVSRTEECSRDEARELLKNGTWTDDPLAAAYFERSNPMSASRRAWLRLQGRSPTAT